MGKCGIEWSSVMAQSGVVGKKIVARVAGRVKGGGGGGGKRKGRKRQTCKKTFFTRTRLES